MTLDEFLEVGVLVTLGSHVFDAESIKAFARKYDPQPFHLDEELAKHSVLGGLCASGWHTAATWMKYNLQNRGPEWAGEGPSPEFGPSPGFRNLKWPKPVYAGETVTFTRLTVDHRALASRPGWRLLNTRNGGYDSTGETVLQFDSPVLIKVA